MELRRFALRFIHSHSDATGIFRNAFREIVALTTSGNRVRHIVSSQDDAVVGLLVTGTLIATDREQGILCLVMHSVVIFVINKSPMFSLRTSILLLASVILAPTRKYTTRHFSQKTPVAPLCEWINRTVVAASLWKKPIANYHYNNLK